MKQRNVLFVDDEMHILNSLRRGLIDEEYKCFFALGGEAALKAMKEHEIAVIVTDMRMPGMDGLTLLKIISEKYPDTVKVVLSGYTQLPQILATINQVNIFKFIPKPWQLEEDIKLVVGQALEYYNMQIERRELKEALERKNAAYQKMLKSLEEIISNAKKDAKQAKEMALFSLSIVNEMFAKEMKQQELKDSFAFAKAIYKDYITLVLSDSVELNPQELLEDIIKDISNKSHITKTDLTGDMWSDLKIKSNPTLIKFVFKALVNGFTLPDEKYSVKFIPEVKNLPDGDDMLECSIIILRTEENAENEEQADALYMFKIDFLTNFLNQAIKAINGSFVAAKAAKTNAGIAAKLQLKVIPHTMYQNESGQASQ